MFSKILYGLVKKYDDGVIKNKECLLIFDQEDDPRDIGPITSSGSTSTSSNSNVHLLMLNNHH